jgi:hypothetical protein
VPHKHCTVRNAKLYKFEFNMRSWINCFLMMAYKGGEGTWPRSSVADPGSGAFLTSGSEKFFAADPDSGSCQS